MRRKIISFVAAAVMAFGLFLNFLPAISAAASDNLIQNGSFEDGLVAGSWVQPDGDVAIDSEKAQNGSNSIVLGAGTNFAQTDYISIEPNTDYRLSGYIFRESGDTHTYLDLWDIPGELQLETSLNNQWEYVYGIWNSGENTSVRVRCVVEGAQAKAWFDNVRFEKIEEKADGGELLDNGSFEDGLVGGSFIAPAEGVAGAVTLDTTKANSGSNSAKISAGTSFVQTGTVNVKKDTDYIISGYIFAEKQGANAYIDLWDIPGEVELSVTKYGEWQKVSGIWNSRSNETIRLRGVVIGEDSGNVWFDDISLKEVTEKTTELTNNGFELDDDMWTSEHPNARSQIVDDFAHTGKRSMRVNPVDTIECFTSKMITVEPDSYYKYSAYVYRENADASAFIDMHDIQGEVQVNASKTGEWEKLTGTWYSGNNTTVILRGVVEGNITGYTWFDDFSFELSSAVEVSGTFEEDDGSWSMSNKEVIDRSNEKAYEGEYSLKSSARGPAVVTATSSPIKLEPYTDYIYSAYIYREDDSSFAYIDFLDAAYELQIRGSKVGEWEYVEGIWNSGENASINMRAVVERNFSIDAPEITGDVYFDNISLVKADQQYGVAEVVNPSFESTGNDGLGNVFGWTITGTDLIYVDDDNVHSGNTAMHSTVRGQEIALFYSKLIPVEKNTDYRISGYIYREDDSGWAYFDLCDITGEIELKAKKTGEWEYLSGVWNSGDHEYVRLRGVAERIAENSGPSYEGTTGDSWFDDIKMEKIVYEPYSEEEVTLSADAEYFTLSSSDTKATIAVDDNKLYLTALKNSETSQSWISGAQQVPFINTISDEPVEWVFDSAKESAKEVRLKFKSTDGKFDLESVWTAPAGEGPISYNSYITNNSGKTVAINDEDVVAADVILSVPENTTLYRFNRSRMNNGLDEDFTTGVLTTDITTELFLKSHVEGNWRTNYGTLPFHMMSDDSGNGLYYGYDWNYGKIFTRTQNDEGKVRMTARLGQDTSYTDREDGEVFEVPGMFFGTYKGSLDDGSNSMKRWFYNNRMTKTLRENEDEPLIELHTSANSEAEWAENLKNDYASWGVGLIKQDYWWQTDTLPEDPGSGFDSYLEQQWLPNKERWPNGMTLGHMAHENGLKLSLYMCDTYQGVDIGTKEGREKQLDALRMRIEDWGVDYWRSDFEVVTPNDYDSFEGLLYILDTLFEEYPDFRYECCSAGGALKNFEMFERLTVMTFEDTGNALNHRMAFYSNSYMVNPIQLKFDVGVDWGSEGTEDWVRYNNRTGMMGAFMVCASTRPLNDMEIGVAKETYKLYNERQRPILRGADVYHILPMPDGENWDGMEFYNNALGKGSIFLFKPSEQAEDEKVIYADGLKSDSVYYVEFEDRDELSCYMTGEQLMNEGIKVTGMTAKYDTEIIWLTDMSHMDIPVDVVFEGDEDSQNLRPAEVIVELLTNGETSGDDKLVLNKENDYSGAFEDYKGVIDGKEVEYSIMAPEIKGYTMSISGSATAGFTVTYTLESSEEKPPQPSKPVDPDGDEDTPELDKPQDDDAPKTGEESTMKIWGIALLAAGLSAMIAARNLRKRSRKQER